ncbi:sensor domain-containing diguanylate cyclase [Paenibacillus xylanilyticus]|uniref:GGDEF domain-containing protein n=1 Tax=Paenibacillus xylanilyticus TaxID=248903 RepID=A0A7Y6C606_9BACL|nr:sensor domain-containing diguanylate cyclase [Paenibacillus xylanilyticus]NUU80179.1 GGDEF domain-containing protein [Paenibacillus xylanilyticus]
MIAENKASRLQGKVRNIKKISLTALLSGLVSISVLMTLTIMFISSYTSQKQSLIDNTLSLNYSSAAQMSQTLDSLFQSMQNSLKYAADYFPQMDYSDTEKLDSTLELIRSSSNFFNSVTLVDDKGVIRSASPYSNKNIGMQISSNAAKKAFESRASYISEAYQSPLSKRRIVFVSEPIFDAAGVFKGMIGGNIFLQENNILNLSFGSQLKTSNGSYFFIVDAKGTLLFHPDTKRIGENISKNEVVQKLLDNQTGKEQYKNLAGVDSLAGYQKVPATDWGVVVVSPTQTVYDQLNEHIRMLLLYTSVPFLILTLIVIRVARKLASPFVYLADLVHQVDQGKVDLPTMRPHWNREADLLTRTVLGALANFRKQTDQLTYDARTDVLTGMTNRRTFEEVIQQWIDEQVTFSIIVIDIDRFKSINDTYGHHAGDQVLKHIAGLIKLAVRPQDVSSRFGGEEFVVLLRHTESDTAYQIAEYIRISVEASIMPVDRSVTISAGIAEYPLHSSSATELFHLADNALYQAKEEGRNRTVTIQTVEK